VTGGRRGTGGLRATTREAGLQLGVPQGFTLSVAGTLAALAGQRGMPGPWPAWLFVTGGGLGFCAVLLAVGAHHDRAAGSTGGLRGRAVFNLLPVAVVPAAVLGTAWIAADTLAFFVAGAVVVVAYVVLLGALAWLTSPGDDGGRPVRPPAPWWRRDRVPSVGRRRHPDPDRSSP
jgi:hypothetical protein